MLTNEEIHHAALTAAGALEQTFGYAPFTLAAFRAARPQHGVSDLEIAALLSRGLVVVVDGGYRVSA